jgi:hypothetical protein
MIDLTKIQTGDVMFLRVRWNPWNIKTYLSRLINFGINFWDGLLNGVFGADYTYCPCNHVGIFINENGTIYLCEADEFGFTRKISSIRLRDINNNDIWVKRFPDLNNVEDDINKMLGTKYDYGFLIREFGDLLTDKKFEGSKMHDFKEGVCSNIVAKILNSSNPDLCKSPYNYTPKDIYFEKGGILLTDIYN